MVCADESDSECAQVLRDVWLFLDDEMDPVNRAKVQQHLDDCSPCLAEAGLDRRLKALLQAKCGGDRAPEGLRTRLVASFSSTQVTAGADQLRVQTTRITTITEG